MMIAPRCFAWIILWHTPLERAESYLEDAAELIKIGSVGEKHAGREKHLSNVTRFFGA
jgi:hypothetical protein